MTTTLSTVHDDMKKTQTMPKMLAMTDDDDKATNQCSEDYYDDTTSTLTDDVGYNDGG